MPLYPLPPLAAMAGFAFILVNRAHAIGELAVAAAIAASEHSFICSAPTASPNGRSPRHN